MKDVNSRDQKQRKNNRLFCRSFLVSRLMIYYGHYPGSCMQVSESTIKDFRHIFDIQNDKNQLTTALLSSVTYTQRRKQEILKSYWEN